MGFRNQLADPLDLSQSPIDINFGRAETAGFAFELAQRDTAMLHIRKQLRRVQLDQEDSPLISPEQANEMAPDLPRSFSEPIKLSVLQGIIAENELQKDLALKIALGPQDLLASTMQFGMSLTAHAIDPIEAGAGFLMTPVVGALGGAMITGKTMVRSARSVKMGMSLARSDRSTFARMATEGLAGNLAVEPLLYMGTMEDHQDASIYNSFVSVVGGSLGFAAAIRGLAEVPRLLTKIGKASTEAHLRVSTGQVSSGKKVKTSEMTKIIIEESHAGGPKPDMPEPVLKSRNTDNTLDMNHDHVPFEGSTLIGDRISEVTGKLKSKRWYIPSRSKNPNADNLQNLNPGTPLGNGITLTDNPVIANGVASQSSLKNPGSVHEVQLDQFSSSTDMNLDILQAKSSQRASMKRGLEKMGLNKSEVTMVLKNNPSYMQAWDRLKSLAHNKNKLKGIRGIDTLDDQFMDLVPGDVLKYETRSTAGVPHPPQNNLFIKESVIKHLAKKGKSPLKKVDQYDADPSFNKAPTKEQLSDLSSDYANKKTDRYYDQEAVDEYNSLNPAKDPVLSEMDNIFQANKQAVDDLAVADELLPDELEVHEKLKTIEAQHKQEMEISKDAYNCRIGI